MDDWFDEWAGIDWGSSPSFDTSFDLSGFDWGNVDLGLGDLDLGAIDIGSLDNFGFDLGDLSSIDYGSLGQDDLSTLFASDALTENELNALLGEVEIPAELDLNQPYQDLEDTGTLLNIEEPVSDSVKNYLLEGTTTPNLGLQGDARYLYQTETEEAPSLPGQGLKEPEVPGLSSMGGGQGLYTEVPIQYDDQGNKIPNTGGYVSQLGFIPYEATPALGDSKSFINDPRKLGVPVFSTDQITAPTGTKTYVDSLTGKTITTTGGATKNVVEKIADEFKKIIGGGSEGKQALKDNAMLLALLGGLMGLLGRKEAPKLPVGYQGGIPKYTAARVPGRGVQYTRAAQGGLMGLANKEHPIKAAKGGQYLKGSSDGMADDIYTNIDGKQPARLSSGEFVVSSDVVSALGSGNSDAGADVLYDMMDRVRKHAYGRKKQITPVNKRKVLPA